MQNMEIDDCSEIVIPNQYGRERENVLRKLGQGKCSQKIFCLGLPRTNAATFKDVGLNIVCICLITILIFLITRWAPIQSNNMEGGVTIAIFLITG